jgi:tripartite-type tricarboxylate transporter receptor subunit TctC
MVHIPFKGWPDAMINLLNGDIDFMFDSTAASIGNIQGQKTRALAVTSHVRDPALPDVPTMAEEGYPTVDATAWFGVLAPGGLPADVRGRLEREIRAIYDRPETQAAMRRIGLKPDFMGSDQFSAYFSADIDKWSKLIHAANIVAD